MTELIKEAFQSFEKTLAYARKYVLNNQEELERKYGERYLAITEEVGVVDSDIDKKSLIKRLQASGGQRGIIIDTIDELTKPRISNN